MELILVSATAVLATLSGMKVHPLLRALVAAILPLLAACSPSKRTTEDGVYTQAQAKRGKVIHTRACFQCHAEGYYKGRKLVESWSGETMGALNTHIIDTMPQDRPSSLTRSQYVDVMAYLLSTYDFPVGEEELPNDQAALAQIIIRKTRN